MSTTEKSTSDNLIFHDIYLCDSEVLRGHPGKLTDFPKQMKQQNKSSYRAAIIEATSSNDDEDHIEKFKIVKILVNLGSRFIADAEDRDPKYSEFLYKTPDKSSEDTYVLFEIEATFCVDFKSKNDVDLHDKKFEEFCSETVLKVVWPFWREHALNSCLKAQAPTFDIPFLES